MHPLTDVKQHQKIWAIAWPMVLANVATTLIGLVDTAILGHLPDTAFIGGAAIAVSLFNIIYLSLAFLRMGTTGLVAQHFGEKNWLGLYTTLILSAGIALLLGFVLIIFSPWLFAFTIPLIGGSDAVQIQAHIYTDIRVLSSPAVLFNFVAVGFLIGIQQSRKALYILLLSQSINIILDFYLAIYLGWQMPGIAWATVISDVCGSALALFFICQFLLPRVSHWKQFQNLQQKLTRIFNLNRDLFIRTIILLSIFAFITAQSARQDDVILAANSILIQLFFFFANIIDGFANAAESRTGELVGASQQNNFLLKKQLSSAINQTFILSLSQAFMVLALSLLLLSIYSSTVLSWISNIPEILSSSEHYFFWLIILMFSAIVCFVLDGIFIGATKGWEMLLAIVMAVVFVFFPVWFLSRSLENHGLWFALCVFMALRSVFTLLMFRYLSKKNRWGLGDY